MITRRLLVLACVALALTACADEDKPPLQIIGGSFVFNYRIAQLTYGVVVRQLRPLPQGSIVEASFDLPGTSDKYVLTKPARAGTLQYSFESVPLKGVKKGEKYTVRIRVLKAGGTEEIFMAEKTYTVDVDQSTLPSKPLVTGPGYDAVPQEP